MAETAKKGTSSVAKGGKGALSITKTGKKISTAPKAAAMPKNGKETSATPKNRKETPASPEVAKKSAAAALPQLEAAAPKDEKAESVGKARQKSAAASQGSIAVSRMLPPRGVGSIWNPKTARFQITMLLLGVVYVNTMLRNTLSIAIVCMVNETGTPGSTVRSGGICTKIETNDTGTNDTTAKPFIEDLLPWSSHDIGTVTSAIFWGGLLPGIPAGYLADRYSPKMIISICLILSGVGSLFIPLAASGSGEYSVLAVFVLRFVMGLGGQATIFPAATALNARWIPPSERTTAMALFTTGAQLAMVIAGPFNTYLCRDRERFGWKAIFYFGTGSVVPILLLWMVFAADTPRKYKWIRRDELQYIQLTLSRQFGTVTVHWRNLPWKQMALSLPLMAAFVSTFSLSAMATSLQAFIPLYLKQSLELELEWIGWVNAIVFIFQLLGKFVSAPFADRIRQRKMISDTWNCKIFNTIGTFGGSALMVAAAYMNCTRVYEAVTYLSLSCALFSFQLSGFLTSLLSMAPAYTGIVNSLSRFCGQIGSVIMPHIVGDMTPNGTMEEWRNVCWLMSSLIFGAGVIFLLFGSADIQSWAIRKEEPIKMEPEEEKTATLDTFSHVSVFRP